jgi:hypothetical protein
MAAKLIHGYIEANPGAQRWFLEDHRQGLTCQQGLSALSLHGSGTIQDTPEIIWLQVGYGE